MESVRICANCGTAHQQAYMIPGRRGFLYACGKQCRQILLEKIQGVAKNEREESTLPTVRIVTAHKKGTHISVVSGEGGFYGKDG